MQEVAIPRTDQGSSDAKGIHVIIQGWLSVAIPPY